MRIHRRRFLQAAGLGAGSLLLPSLSGRRGAKAGPATPPMRLVICFTEHGVVHQNWGMRMGMPDDQRWDYDLTTMTEAEFSPSLRPLWRHRNKLTVVDGLSLATAIADPYGDGHAKGWCSALTGGIARETIESVKSNAFHMSLDQVIGKALRQADPGLTDLVTLEMGIFQYNFHAAIYGEGAPGAPVVRMPHEEQPQGVFDRIFPNGDGTQPPDPIRVAQPDVLASVADMYDSVSARLSTRDRQKLEQHRDLIRDMEARLRHLAMLDCGPPTIEDYYWGEVPHPQRFTAHTNSFWDLATVAMSCGLTRVTTMQWGQLPVEMIGGTGDLHHDYAHPSDPNQSTNPQYPLAIQVMTNYTAQYADYIAQLADKLDAIPEDNGTLLDNTMILMVSEISHGGHGHDRWPVVIVGGGNRLRTGRYFNFEHDTLTTTTASWVDDDTTIGYPHNHLLVAIAQAMGLSTDTVGDATVRPKKTSAPDIDLRGPLPGLLR
jgi:hypothetical protein